MTTDTTDAATTPGGQPAAPLEAAKSFGNVLR